MAKPDSEPKPAPSADEQALLAAVIAHPDEDTPRLIYADWLQEHDQPERAEFIRAQIEVTRLPPDDPSAKALRARVVELAERYRKEWYGGTVFVRGFPVAQHLYNLYEILRDPEGHLPHSLVRVLYAQEAFPDSAEEERAVVSSRHFERLTGLGSYSRGWDGHRVAHILTSPYLANLRLLDFYCGCYNRAEGARGIAAATHLTNLLVLGLSGNEIGDEGLAALAASKHLASLRALRLALQR